MTQLVGKHRTRILAVTLLVVVCSGVGAMAATAPTLTAVLLVVGLGIGTMACQVERATVLTIAVLVLPLFVNLSTQTLTIGSLFQSVPQSEDFSTRVHIGFLWTAALAGILVLRNPRSASRSRTPGSTIFVVLGSLFTLSIVVGLTSGAGTIGLAFYAQTIAPFFAWYAMAHLPVSIRRASRTIEVAAFATMAPIIVLAVASSSLFTGYSLLATIEAVVPQYRSYFPLIVSVALALAVARWHLDRWLSLGVIIASVAMLPLMWSRTGLVMLVIAGGVAFCAGAKQGRRSLRVLVAGLCGVVGLAFIPRLLSLGVLGERSEDSASLSKSDATRLDLAAEGVSRLLDSPLLGDMFVPYSPILAGGREADFSRLFPTHNQYLDFALRGGVVCLVALLVLFAFYAHRSMGFLQHSSSQEDRAFHAALLAVTLATAAGSMTQLFVSQTWTGSLLLAMFGISSSRNLDRRASEPERRGADAQRAARVDQ